MAVIFCGLGCVGDRAGFLSVSEESACRGGRESESWGELAVYVPPTMVAKHVTVRQVRDMLERPTDGHFLAVNKKADWDRYKNLLASDYARKVGKFTGDDYTFMEMCTLLRNMSAHRSDESYQKVTQMVTGPALKRFDAAEGVRLSRSRGITRTKVGHYLATEMKNPYRQRQNTRLAFMLGRLRRMSEVLR